MTYKQSLNYKLNKFDPGLLEPEPDNPVMNKEKTFGEMMAEAFKNEMEKSGNGIESIESNIGSLKKQYT